MEQDKFIIILMFHNSSLTDMRKFLALLSILLISACSEETIKDITLLSHLRIVVQEPLVGAIYNQDDTSVKWEDGEEIIFRISILSPTVQGGLLFDDDYLFSTSGKIVFERDEWTLFEASDSGFWETDAIKIESNCPDSPVDIDFQYNKKTDKDAQDSFTCRYHISVPFQENQMIVHFNPAEMLSFR